MAYREGSVLTTFVDPETRDKLHVMAAVNRTTIKKLINEAIKRLIEEHDCIEDQANDYNKQ